MRRMMPPAMDTARMVDWFGSPMAKTSVWGNKDGRLLYYIHLFWQNALKRNKCWKAGPLLLCAVWTDVLTLHVMRLQPRTLCSNALICHANRAIIQTKRTLTKHEWTCVRACVHVCVYVYACVYMHACWLACRYWRVFSFSPDGVKSSDSKRQRRFQEESSHNCFWPTSLLHWSSHKHIILTNGESLEKIPYKLSIDVGFNAIH